MPESEPSLPVTLATFHKPERLQFPRPGVTGNVPPLVGCTGVCVTFSSQGDAAINALTGRKLTDFQAIGGSICATHPATVPAGLVIQMANVIGIQTVQQPIAAAIVQQCVGVNWRSIITNSLKYGMITALGIMSLGCLALWARARYSLPPSVTKRQPWRCAFQRFAASRGSRVMWGGSEWEQSQAAARHRRWANLLERYKQPANPEPVRLEVAVLGIGDMALVLTNGELFSEIGAAVKKASPFKVTMFCGYGNHPGGGYMPIRSEYAFGSYEVDGTSYGPGAAEKVIDEAIALLKSIR